MITSIGMVKDELLRLKQITGLASLFNDKEFSDGFNRNSKDKKVVLTVSSHKGKKECRLPYFFYKQV
jgi:hypothetical protein